jgi:catechol 2,3-dioxygenase-like lactoylglutathione lyase family enzyme
MRLLFSYGTLQQEAVQLAAFGRLLRGQPDELVGFELGVIRIEDPAFVARSGKAEHAIVRWNGRDDSRVRGMAFEVTDDELALADRYEPAGYVRVSAKLASGQQAWVYAAARVRIKIEGLTPLLQVFDMPTSVAFYRDVLGFEVVSSAPPRAPPRAPDDFDWGLLRKDGFDLMLNTAYELDDRPPQPKPERVAAHGDTALYLGCRDVDGAYRELKEKGLDLLPPNVAPYGMKQLYFKDPDGYSICLQWRAKEDEASGSRE